MNWSYSQGKLFQKCPRQWYFKTHVAWHNAKDPLRRHAYRLSKLDSVWSWRGRIVDTVLSTSLIPRARQKKLPRIEELQRYADQLFETQLSYARVDGIRKANLNVKATDFAALRDIEYGRDIPEEDFERARADIHLSLQHVMKNDGLLSTFLEAQQIVAQRNLHFELAALNGGKITVQATPDVIVFRRKQPPIIIDWKVKYFSYNDARDQLMVYGLALKSAKRHSDFPVTATPFVRTEVEEQPTALVEYQLLDDIVREYSFGQVDVERVEDSIQVAAIRMSKFLDASFTPADYAQLPVAVRPEACSTCNFKLLCWEDNFNGP